MLLTAQITNYISYAWVLGIIMVLSSICAILLLRNIYSDKLKQKDQLIELTVTACFILPAFIAEFIFGIENMFKYAVVFAVIGIVIEFTYDLLWYRLMGTRLYRYFKANISGFTSWYILPYWFAAGLFFYGLYQVIVLITPAASLQHFNSQEFLRSVSPLILLTFIILSFSLGFYNYLRGGKVKQQNTFSWNKYMILNLPFLISLPYFVLYTNNIYMGLYLTISGIVGVVLEGLLANKIKNIYGENLWLYYRYSVFKGGSSLLILPVWSLAALIALLIFNTILL